MTEQEKHQKIKEFHVIKQLLYMTYKPDLPRHFTNNTLYLAKTDIKSLPEDLYVPDDLHLQGCTSLTSLPKGLHVGMSLFLHWCKNLTSIPKGLHVGGDLYMPGCTSLTSLSEDLYVGGDLHLDGCNLLSNDLVFPNVKGKIYR